MASKLQVMILVVLMLLTPIFQQVYATCYPHHYKKVVAVPIIAIYQVGVDLEIEAAKEQARGEERAKIQAEGLIPQYQDMAPLFYSKCGQCHGSDKSSYGKFYNMSEGLDPNTYVRVRELIRDKKDVPEKMTNVINGIKPEEQVQMLAEIVLIAKETKRRKAGSTGVVSNPMGY